MTTYYQQQLIVLILVAFLFVAIASGGGGPVYLNVDATVRLEPGVPITYIEHHYGRPVQIYSLYIEPGIYQIVYVYWIPGRGHVHVIVHDGVILRTL